MDKNDRVPVESEGGMSNKKRKPLPAGTEIDYCDMRATVVADDGGPSLTVDCEGSRQIWTWVLEGIACTVVGATTEPDDPAETIARLNDLVLKREAEIDRLKSAPNWWRCDTHGAGTREAWGCPECVRELRAEVERLREIAREAAESATKHQADVLRLRKDAERYRWLRHGDNDETCIRLLFDSQPYLLRSDRLDAAIDAAMAGSGL